MCGGVLAADVRFYSWGCRYIVEWEERPKEIQELCAQGEDAAVVAVVTCDPLLLL